MDQTKQLIEEFNVSKVGQVLNGKEAFRNKVGCLLHGLTHKHPKLAMLGSSALFAGGTALMGPLAAAPTIFPAAYGAAVSFTAKGRLQEKASCDFLMNHGVRKTAAFSNFLDKKGIDAATKEAALQTYLKSQAPKFGYFRDYIRQFPNAVQQIMSSGMKGDLPLIHSQEVYHLEAVQEALTKGHNKGGILHGLVQSVLPKTKEMEKKAGEVAAKRWADRKAWEAMPAETREPWRKFSKAKEFERYAATQAGKTVGKEATEQVVKSAEKTASKEAGAMQHMLAQASHPATVQAEKVAQQVGTMVEKPVAKAAEKETVKVAEKTLPQAAAKTAKRLPLSPPLVKKISEETAKKTGAKIATKGVGKTLAKKIPLIGLACGIGFGIMRAFDGDWTGAGMELSSGAASCFPGVGTAASVGIDAALIARDVAGSR